LISCELGVDGVLIILIDLSRKYKIIVTSKMFDGTRLDYVVPGYTG